LRVLYDGFIYGGQVAGGINRYFANIVRRLPENFTPLLTTCITRKINFLAHKNIKIFKFQRFYPRRISRRIEKIYFRAIEKFIHFDIVHPTYYSLLTGKEIADHKKPAVLNVWDMTHEIFHDQIDPDGREAYKKRKAILQADKIICISENTKSDLLDRYPVNENKVTVTYLASEINASISHGLEPIPVNPYYLYVGGRYWYKNFDGLLIAFANAVSKKPNLVLCIVGPPFDKSEKMLISKFKLLDHIEHYGYVDDCHLAKLYRCSIAFVYPTLYEGFGIPLLEAMSCGTAVVASNCSSIPEVVGDAGLLFNPKKNSDLSDILLFLVDNPAERNSLIEKGVQRAMLFSWDKTVQQTLKIYKDLL
jgi:glycosyltransferase involved in cell wall biosynthesis